jgi:hypothetical protein
MIPDDIQDMIYELEEAADLDGTELGEMWDKLCTIQYVIGYGLSDNFERVWIEEIREQYKDLKERFEIIETTQTIEKTVTTRSLEMKEDL